MATADDDTQYDLDYTLNIREEIFGNKSTAERVIKGAAEPAVIEFLLDESDDHSVRQPIDLWYESDHGIGSIRKAILSSEHASTDLKRTVVTRDSDPRDYTSLVPDSVRDNAFGALAAGKPVVLYGPTGTGKTTFAKQLAINTSIGYDIHTASPSWTEQNIVGRLAPNFSGEGPEYVKEPGCVTKAVLRAQDFGGQWSVIIDELTRADISRIFGPLYTAIENPSQTLFEIDGKSINLDASVNIICTMNVSDRTVNELDNAITRRFAMIEVSDYEREDRDTLFRNWVSNYLAGTSVDRERLLDLFHADYERLNYGPDRDSDGLMQFGPMHYEDVAKFLGKVCASRTDDDNPGVGCYHHQPKKAVGEAFCVYIVPRLLNEATFPQIKNLVQHYRSLEEKFDEFNMELPAALAEQRHQAEHQRMGGT